MIKIDRDIPLPVGRPTKYPLHIMEVGESILVTDAPRSNSGHYRPIAGRANKKHAPKKFAQRQVPEGLRIWRIT